MNQPIPKYNGPIAVLDMLCFKKYVETFSLDEIISEYANIITGASFTASILKEDLQFMVYSDTIAIHLVNQSEKGFYNFIKALNLICNSFFYKCQIPGMNPIPIRGAIGCGDYSWHNGSISSQVINRKAIIAEKVNFIVGQAVIDAHEHEKVQQWIGVSMNLNTAQVLKAKFPFAFSELTNQKLLIEYDIPIKNSTIQGFVINPTERSTFDNVFGNFLEKCKSIIENTEEYLDVKLKYYNTIIFLNEVHTNNSLIPYIDKKEFEIKIDKSKFNSLIKFYDENVKTNT
jgi:hypothetical protein